MSVVERLRGRGPEPVVEAAPASECRRTRIRRSWHGHIFGWPARKGEPEEKSASERPNETKEKDAGCERISLEAARVVSSMPSWSDTTSAATVGDIASRDCTSIAVGHPRRTMMCSQGWGRPIDAQWHGKALLRSDRPSMLTTSSLSSAQRIMEHRRTSRSSSPASLQSCSPLRSCSPTANTQCIA